MRTHPIYKFQKLEVMFCKHCQKIQTDEQMYMAL
jgi:hypothetical protein